MGNSRKCSTNPPVTEGRLPAIWARTGQVLSRGPGLWVMEPLCMVVVRQVCVCHSPRPCMFTRGVTMWAAPWQSWFLPGQVSLGAHVLCSQSSRTQEPRMFASPLWLEVDTLGEGRKIPFPSVLRQHPRSAGEPGWPGMLVSPSATLLKHTGGGAPSSPHFLSNFPRNHLPLREMRMMREKPLRPRPRGGPEAGGWTCSFSPLLSMPPDSRPLFSVWTAACRMVALRENHSLAPCSGAPRIIGHGTGWPICPALTAMILWNVEAEFWKES